MEEIPRLPNDVNPLDPGLVDARYHAIFNANARNMGGGGGNIGNMGGNMGMGGHGQGNIAMPGMNMNMEAIIAQFLEMQADGEHVDLDAIMLAAENQIQQLQQQQQHGGEHGQLQMNPNNTNNNTNNIDLNAPMMQLFLQSLMPWNGVLPTQEALEYGQEQNEEDEEKEEEEE